VQEKQMTAYVNETFEWLKQKGISTDDIYAIAYELEQKVESIWDNDE
jgi:hypothetical protein